MRASPLAIEPLDGHCVAPAPSARASSRATRMLALPRQRHGRVLDHGVSVGLAFGELHHPCSPSISSRAFGARRPCVAPGRPAAVLRFRHGFVGLHLAHELVNAGPRRPSTGAAQRAVAVLRRRGRDPERAEAVVAGEVEVLEQGQPRRLSMKRMTRSPQRSGRASSTAPGGAALLDGQKLLGDERQVFAQREAAFEPALRIAHDTPCGRSRRDSLADQAPAAAARVSSHRYKRSA